ncbi:MAG: ASKHA domain-containing protein [Dissulfurimicrobium sp.]|uniref:ASKHA domain-containing protein n=1 Tax=Dissulfurimicrobium sp. TaxID=2022436 RepID=UPI00404AAF55
MTKKFDPVVRLLDLNLPLPSLEDNASYEARLRSCATRILGKAPKLQLNVLRNLAPLLAKSDYNIKAVVIDGPCGWEIAEVSSRATVPDMFGVGIDLGSTSVVFYLVDMMSGNVIKTISMPNPQRRHGEDILDRIIFAGRPGGLDTLKNEITSLFNDAISRLGGPDNCFFISIAGNTTMCHLLLGLDPAHICKEPYLPIANTFDLMRPSDIGIKAHEGAWAYIFPNIGSYFGGDLLSGILATEIHLKDEISMLIDVGTNAEVVLGNRDWLVACAGAAGPALEGGILSCGMMAGPGAIERVSIDRETLKISYTTIAGRPPIGICGSGAIDLLSALFLAGLVDQTGKLVLSRDRGRMRNIDGEWAYVLADERETGNGRPVYISQGDIKNLIRSKAAMYAILNVVIQGVGIGFEDIDTFYVAGAFGNYIDPANAIAIGMLPDVPIDRFQGVGNSAGRGAVEFLRRRSARKEIEEIRDKITYLEMNVHGDFMSQLTAALFLPHTDLDRFPSVKAMLGQTHE